MYMFYNIAMQPMVCRFTLILIVPWRGNNELIIMVRFSSILHVYIWRETRLILN